MKLYHTGVLGMKWGHHKPSHDTAHELHTKINGVSIKQDGSMAIKKDVSIQRLIRNGSDVHTFKNLTYASLNEYDNAKYIKYIGGKGFFGGGRDTIVNLKTTKPIKSPSVNDATKITSDLFLNNDKFRNTFTNVFGGKISEGDLNRIRKDPVGNTAKAWYSEINRSLTLSANFDKNSPYVQETVKQTFKKNGFNALRDENDYQAKVSKSPIIIFDPEETLEVTKISDITDDIRKESKETVQKYKDLGNKWIDENIYN